MITIYKSGANATTLMNLQADSGPPIVMCQSKYLNNLIEQDQLVVKHIADSALSIKSFWSALKLIAGTETMRTTKKWQSHRPDRQAMFAANQMHSVLF